MAKDHGPSVKNDKQYELRSYSSGDSRAERRGVTALVASRRP